MNQKEFEKILNEYSETYSQYFQSMSRETRNKLFAIIQQTIVDINIISEQELLSRLNTIDKYYSELKVLFEEFTIQTVPAIFNLSLAINSELLSQLSTAIVEGKRDSKALRVLVRDMIQDFNIAATQGQEAVTTFFKISKQGQIRESDISRLVAKGILDKGNIYEAKKLVRASLDTRILDDSKLDAYKKRLLAQARKKYSTLKETVKNKLLAKYEKKLKDGKFLQIVNKNGKIMTFRVETYSDLVARTRFGEAQVIGTIEQGSRYGISEYQVTDHNTTSEICIPHEGKIYTTDKNDTRFKYLTAERRPLYHPNCQHRLFPRSIL